MDEKTSVARVLNFVFIRLSIYIITEKTSLFYKNDFNAVFTGRTNFQT